ncbi:hypothetical protein CJD36_002880 [Flavipsychrobacter stenotrophus]|uniref:Uncharacterized protein n=1 Tax=Flavipsychrobacter stenotrophus TaxID=2077091 RepID=A0A2S7T1S2_9BACT|nr:hypothetical protein [Flavipsychrobacter stenotrophus]PQJ12706.1 hypothetical protein CJD36_002880 [Flavipsychrobacter stenotrophus]
MQTISCKKSSTVVVAPTKDTVSGNLLINWMGLDHSYKLNAKDTLLGFSISQGSIASDSNTLFTKHLRIYLTDHVNVGISIFAHKLDEIQDTGIYYVGTIGGYYYGDFWFSDMQSGSSYSWSPMSDVSYVHVTEFTKGKQNNMKANFFLVGYPGGSVDRQVITGNFDITR